MSRSSQRQLSAILPAGFTDWRTSMEISRKKWVTIAVAAGALLGTAGIAGAVTGSSSTTKPPATSAPSTHTSNTDPAHEAGESAQHAADEASGKFDGGHDGPGGHDGHSNTDPAHEDAESPARQAEEAQRDANPGSDGASDTAPTSGVPNQ